MLEDEGYRYVRGVRHLRAGRGRPYLARAANTDESNSMTGSASSRPFTRRSAVALGLGTALAPLATRVARAVGKSGPLVTLLAGEPGSESILLQARFASAEPLPGDFNAPSPGAPGRGRFEISRRADFAGATVTPWIDVDEARDHIIRFEATGLAPATRYFYRAQFEDSSGRRSVSGRSARFRTLPGPASRASVSFAVISCMSYELFYGLGKAITRGDWSTPASGEARRRGYPAMDVLSKASIDFQIATGDTVYYDHPNSDHSYWAKSIPEMRQKWHRQFSLPAVREALAASATYFMKDDHDFRYDDSDNSGSVPPSPADGRKVFLEQAPVLAGQGRTYRTIRINRYLQIWLLEGRDYRSDNAEPDTEAKTIWGAEQRQWLEQGLLASDADFKLVISPTPIVGPDDARKSDNQTSAKGFQVEGIGFLEFLRSHGLTESTFIVNGDRHWKYHSVHPTGVEEFSCGTVHRQNSRPGVAPGNPQGTDPKATIRQPYLQPVPDGGFIQIDIEPDANDERATMLVRFWSEDGRLQYAVRRFGKRAPLGPAPGPTET